jgi:Mor family transcriptional regulator
MEIKDWAKEVKAEDIPSSFQDIVYAIGIEALLKLSFSVGGTTLYVPKPEFFLHKAKERLIIDEYNKGSTIKELALRYQLSDACIRKIISDYFLEKEQLKLFEKDVS